ncbi:MAG: hypothetical protein KY432_11880, partial [Acidobacteria bacterium]|nr:hypothetical protein [Acidobacteriota bacterium]
ALPISISSMSFSSQRAPTLYTFAEHTLDEVWLSGSRLVLSHRAVTRGQSATTHSPDIFAIEAATDFRSPEAVALRDRLLSIQMLESHRDSALDRLARVAGKRSLSCRMVLSHRIDGDSESLTIVLRAETLREDGTSLALLTTPRHLDQDIETLLHLGDRRIELERSDLGSLPVLWASGSGGVLLHECAGHPAGISTPAVWPEWLQVVDDPSVETFDRPINHSSELRRADLLAGEPPSSRRRASFRDHPRHRMSTLVGAAVKSAPFQLPARHIEIELAAGGSWDPLTDQISVNVLSASLVDGKTRRRVAPFLITGDRAQVAGSITGGRGEAIRYPGVLCSEHGQRLPVGTYCLDLITEGV